MVKTLAQVLMGCSKLAMKVVAPPRHAHSLTVTHLLQSVLKVATNAMPVRILKVPKQQFTQAVVMVMVRAMMSSLAIYLWEHSVAMIYLHAPMCSFLISLLAAEAVKDCMPAAIFGTV